MMKIFFSSKCTLHYKDLVTLFAIPFVFVFWACLFFPSSLHVVCFGVFLLVALVEFLVENPKMWVFCSPTPAPVNKGFYDI